MYLYIIHVYVYYVYIYVICIYRYIYVYMYMHIYMHTYTHAYICVERTWCISDLHDVDICTCIDINLFEWSQQVLCIWIHDDVYIYRYVFICIYI